MIAVAHYSLHHIPGSKLITRITIMTNSLVVRKLNLQHEVVIAYEGCVLEQSPTTLVLEARFNRETMDLGYAVFESQDRFIEHFFADRWYNIFEIHAVHDDHLKGWYCNIVQPAVFEAESVEQVDLALDLWINPDGSYRLLDQDEFEALPLDQVTRLRARQAVNEVIVLLYEQAAPFTGIAQPRAV